MSIADPRTEVLRRLDRMRLNLTENVNTVTVRNNTAFALMHVEGAISILSKLEEGLR